MIGYSSGPMVHWDREAVGGRRATLDTVHFLPKRGDAQLRDGIAGVWISPRSTGAPSGWVYCPSRSGGQPSAAFRVLRGCQWPLCVAVHELALRKVTNPKIGPGPA